MTLRNTYCLSVTYCYTRGGDPAGDDTMTPQTTTDDATCEHEHGQELHVPLVDEDDQTRGYAVFDASKGGSAPDEVQFQFTQDGQIDWEAMFRPYGSGGWQRVKRVECKHHEPRSSDGTPAGTGIHGCASFEW